MTAVASAGRLRIRRVVLASVLGLALWTTSAGPAAACTGGLPLDIAVAQQQGGILLALVTSAHDRPDDFTTDLTLSEPRVIRGSPPLESEVHAVAGLICDQHVDVGETVMLVFDVTGLEWANPLPLAYVIDGADALDPKVVSSALAAVPPTDTALTEPGRMETVQSIGRFSSLWSGALAFAITLRRANRGSEPASGYSPAFRRMRKSSWRLTSGAECRLSPGRMPRVRQSRGRRPW